MNRLYALLHEISAFHVPPLPQCNQREPQNLSRERRLTPQIFWLLAVGLNQPTPSLLRGHDLKCSEARSAAPSLQSIANDHGLILRCQQTGTLEQGGH